MVCKNLFSVISLALFVFIGNTALAACPSTDLTGDCFVDYEDFAEMGVEWLDGYDSNDLTEMAKQWLSTDPCVPSDMVYIPDGEFEMGDHFAEGNENELPLHAVLLDAFFMSKYEITNQQYCDYLNDANSLGLIEVRSGVVYASLGGTDPYCNTHSYDTHSQIDYNDVSGTFSVRTKGGRDMSDDPMVEVSWYGCVAYCNWRSSAEGKENCYNLSTWVCDFTKKSYRLATEAEWEYAARGGLSGKRFPWGDTINHDYANYKAYGSYYTYDTSPYTTGTFHPDWNDGIWPYTSVVGSFSANGYGLYGMAGNGFEWCNDWYGSYEICDPSPCDNSKGPASSSWGRVIRGGHWGTEAYGTRVTNRYYSFITPDQRSHASAFRIVLDLN